VVRMPYYGSRVRTYVFPSLAPVVATAAATLSPEVRTARRWCCRKWKMSVVVVELELDELVVGKVVDVVDAVGGGG